MTKDPKGSSYNKRVSVVGHRCFICGFFYAQDVRYFARGMDAGSDYAQDVRYFAGGRKRDPGIKFISCGARKELHDGDVFYNLVWLLDLYS